ncbi:MAG: hypothetical protein LBN71_01030, partial [Tannerella sp.]|nr:hypothetical protein [Tannerella sp.]
MNKVSVLSMLSLLILSILAGCNDINDYSTNPSHRLAFSVDTLSFDTIFSSVGSTTGQFMIYNPNDEALTIESVVLANAGKSGFRINVDGRKGDSFQGIDIWKKDSLYVLVEVTVNPNGANQPFIVEDSILFYTNGLRQSVLLQAYGQNVHLIKGGVTFTKDTTLVSDLPYLVYDSILVSEGATLTVEKGAIFYLHNSTNLIVSGTLKAKGTQDEPVIFRGDRLDVIQANVLLPYDRTPGQWGGMYFNSTSFGNEFDYVIVRNGSSGLTFRESEPDRLKIDIRNSQITNMDKNLLTATNAHIEASNSEFSNSSGSIAALVGGKYRFTHCTLANYKVIGNIRDINSPCLLLANEVEVDKEKKFYALQQAWFENCIIDGNFSADTTHQFRGEILLYTNDEKPE